MTLPPWLRLDVRPGPSANVVLAGEVLVDAGAGTPASDARLDAFLGGVEPSLLVCTHWHADHVGGVARLRSRGVPVAAGEAEAALIAAGDPRAWDGAWLGWPMAPYAVDRSPRGRRGARRGRRGAGGDPDAWADAGHLALWEPESRTLVTGDLLQARDVGWMPVGGPWAAGAADALIASVSGSRQSTRGWR